MLMASLRDPYAAAAAAGVGVGMLAASQLAQLNQLMMQQQQHAQQLQLQQQQPLSPSQQPGALAGTPLGTPPECQSPPISRTYTYKKVSATAVCEGGGRPSPVPTTPIPPRQYTGTLTKLRN